MIPCPACAAPISAEAGACPKCGHVLRAGSVQATPPCKTCGASLDVDSLIQKRTGPTFVNYQQADGFAGVTYLPCPNCGDPQPFAATERRKYAFLIGVFALIAAIAIASVMLS